MNRRSLLATVGLASASVAGCVDGVRRSVAGEIEYEQCGKTNVVLSELPEDARAEARSAIEDGAYETSDEPLLPEVIDLEETHIQSDDTYWLVSETGEGETTRFEATEALPPVEPLSMVNRDDIPLTISRRVVHERDDIFSDPVLIDDRQRLEAGYVTSALDVDAIGEYTAEIVINGDVRTELSFERTRTTDVEIIVTESGATTEETDVEPRPRNCQWNDGGELDPERL